MIRLLLVGSVASVLFTGSLGHASSDRNELFITGSTTFAADGRPDLTILPAVGLFLRPIESLSVGVEVGYRFDVEHIPSGNVAINACGLWWWGNNRHHLILGGLVGIDPETIDLGLPGLQLAPLLGYGLRKEAFELQFAWAPRFYWLRARCPGCGDYLFLDPIAFMAQVAIPIW